MSSSFSDSFGETDLSGEVRFDRRGRFVMYKKLTNPEPMNNPSKSPLPTDESSSTKETNDSKVHSSEGMAELLLENIRHINLSNHLIAKRKVISLSILF